MHVHACRGRAWAASGHPCAARYSGPQCFGPSAWTDRTCDRCPAGARPVDWCRDGPIVVGDRVLLDAGFRAARARLEILVRDGMLAWACEVAYGEGTTGLVKLAGPAAGLTRLAGVRLDDLSQTDSCAHIPLQWEAIAADGKLFTALNADLMLVPAGDQIAALALAGAYRPGRRQAGPGDRAPLRHGGHPQLPGPGGGCAHPPRGHGRVRRS